MDGNRGPQGYAVAPAIKTRMRPEVAQAPGKAGERPMARLVAGLASALRYCRRSCDCDVRRGPRASAGSLVDPAHARWQAELHRTVADARNSELGHTGP